MGLEGGADFFHMGSVAADGFMELVPSDAEFFGPVGDVGGHLGVDLLRVMRAFDVVFVEGVGFVDFGGVVVLGHRLLLLHFSYVDENGSSGDACG